MFIPFDWFLKYKSSSKHIKSVIIIRIGHFGFLTCVRNASRAASSSSPSCIRRVGASEKKS
jgi:hypothetical protein